MRNVRKSFPEAVVGEYFALFFEDDIYYNYKGFEWNKSKKGGLFEYDIYIPSLRLAIEYDGEYFHSDDKLKNDIEKSRLAKEHNITLLRIREANAPEIEGNVIKTSNNYTIGNFQDLFLELNKWLSNHYSIKLDYFGANEVNKLMVKTARKMDMMNDKINKFCNDLQIFIQQNPNQRIVRDSYFIDKEGNKNNISHRYYSLRSDKNKGYLTDEEIAKIASLYPPFLEGPKEMVGLRNDDKWLQYLNAYKEYWEIHKTNPGNDDKNASYNGIPHKKLMDWISDQKTELSKHLIGERKEELVKINPSFFLDKRYTSFDEMLELYADYEKNNNVSVLNIRTEYKGAKLGQWVNQQVRSLAPELEKYKSNTLQSKLLTYKINRILQVVPEKESFFLSPSERRWNSQLNAYKNIYENLDNKVFSQAEKDASLKWGLMQKQYYKKGTIKEGDKKYIALTAVNKHFFDEHESVFPNTKEEIWNVKFEKYKDWCIKNNTFHVPFTEKDIFNFVNDMKDAKNQFGENANYLWKTRFDKILAFNTDFFKNNAEIQAEQWLTLYKQYIHEKGTLYISSTDEYKGQKLGGRITKDMSNFANKKEKFNPDSPYYLPEIEKEYLALVPGFSVENTYGVIEPPTSEQKYLLNYLGKSEDDAPTKQYADYYLHKLDEQLVNAGKESIFKHLFSYTPPVNQIIIPSIDEINDFCKKVHDTVNASFTKYIRSVPHGISKLQLGMAGNGIHIEKENNKFVIKNNNNSLLAIPIIGINADKKEWAKIPDILANNAYCSVYESLSNALPAITDEYDKVHHVLVDILHTDGNKLNIESFDNICKKHECTTFANRKYKNAKDLVEDVTKERENLSKSKSDLQNALTELRVTQRIDTIQNSAPVKTQSIKLK